MVIARDLGKGELVLNGDGVSDRKDERVLKIVMAAAQCECI
jgi:hypothetical protein